ncbi:MAG: hypothetical protein ACYTKD_30340 [Planctomycetota bacterium]|jgi:predicted  nucleic acid-binding Zn-ribbon protein
MKQLPVAGVVVGILALFLSSAALFSNPGGGEEMGRRIGSLNEGVSALKDRIDSIEADLASVTAKSGDASKALADLSARVSKTESGVSRVGRSLEGIPKAPAAGGAGTDPEKLRETVQAQIRAQFDRFRQQGMAGRGGDRRDPAQSLREDVGLNEEKAAKVVKAEQKMREEIGRYFRENRGGDRDAARKIIEKAHENARAELAKSLTPEEMKKYGEWHDRQRRGGGRGRGRGGQQPREQNRPDDNAAF